MEHQRVKLTQNLNTSRKYFTEIPPLHHKSLTLNYPLFVQSSVVFQHLVNDTMILILSIFTAFQRRHNERNGVSDHRLSRLFAHPFVQAHMKENIKAPRHSPLWGETTGIRWLPLAKSQVSIWWRHHGGTLAVSYPNKVRNEPKWSVFINKVYATYI